MVMASSTPPVEELVAGLHVRQGRPVEDVGDEGQEAVAQPVRGEHVLPLPGEPAAVDDLGLALEHRVEQPGPVVGVVLEVGVLDQHQFAPGRLETGPHRRALARVGPVGDDPHGRVLQGGQHLVGPVRRAVVDDHHLEVSRAGRRPACAG